MRCSSCEPLLDAYVERVASPAVRARVDEHISACRNCRELLEELRVIDALLRRPRRIDPPPDLTRAVMAEIGPEPPPQAPAIPALALFGTYLAFAWIAIAAWFIVGGDPAREGLALLASAFVGFGGAFAALGGSGSNLFGHSTVGVSAAMGLILILDVVLAAALALGFLIMRARRAARFAGTSEVSR
jgi:anti-sigma factor RsiW